MNLKYEIFLHSNNLKDHNFIQFDEKNEYLVKDMSTFYPPKNRNKGPETRIIFMKDPK